MKIKIVESLRDNLLNFYILILYFSFTLFCLAWDYISRTWTFFAFPDLEFDLLAFIERSEAFRFNLGVMDKQIIASVVRLDEAVPLT